MPDDGVIEEEFRPITRIPLDVVVTLTGAATGGKVVAVMVSELDALEGQRHNFRKLWNDTSRTAERQRVALVELLGLAEEQTAVSSKTILTVTKTALRPPSESLK